MKRNEILNCLNDELLENLYGFCYSRTRDSYEAEDLCSDIVLSLVKSASSDGEIENAYSFIWRVARNVYADFSEKKKKRLQMFYDGDTDSVMSFIPDKDENEDSDDSALLDAVYKRIAFLTGAYREVMISFYLDGLSTREIAKNQNISETAVRQRLFSARQKIKSEVEEMENTNTSVKPVALDKVDFVIWGTGRPSWCDPRKGFERSLSKQIVWLCRKKPMSATEIAEILNVPTLYIEEELEILVRGDNGEYGLLRRADGGRYIINFVLLEKDVFEKANGIYLSNMPEICERTAEFIKAHEKQYLEFPYINKKVDMNLILWQQIKQISYAFEWKVHKILSEKYFPGLFCPNREFSVYGYVDNGKYYGGGQNGTYAENLCGYSKVEFENICIARIKEHFSYGHNIATDAQLQLALRAIDGLPLKALSEQEKEHAAKAIKCGYLYRDGDMLYTKILVCDFKDWEHVYDISNSLRKDAFTAEAEAVAEKLAKLFKEAIPEHLMPEWGFANSMAGIPVPDMLVEALVEKGILTPPENGIGAEGCWAFVEK